MGEVKTAVRNWRTTAFGVGSQLMLIANELLKLIDESVETSPDWNVIAVAFTAACAFFSARDAKVSSKSMGINE